MVDAGGLAVHRLAGPHDLAAVRGPDALVAQADAENGDAWADAADHLRRYAGLIR